jgi:hypothetical protein
MLDAYAEEQVLLLTLTLTVAAAAAAYMTLLIVGCRSIDDAVDCWRWSTVASCLPLNTGKHMQSSMSLKLLLPDVAAVMPLQKHVACCCW